MHVRMHVANSFDVVSPIGEVRPSVRVRAEDLLCANLIPMVPFMVDFLSQNA